MRCLLLVMCTHPVAKEGLTLHLARSEGVVSKNTNALKTHVPEQRVGACHAFRVRLPRMDEVHGAGPSTFGPSGALCLCRGVRLRLPVRVRRDRDAGSWCRSAHRPLGQPMRSDDQRAPNAGRENTAP